MHDVAPGARAHGGPRTTRDAPVPPPGSGVSFVMPVLNEERYLRNAVESVMKQEVDGPAELVLALGPSTDATDAIARELAAADARIRLIPNPAADIPVALNLAIAASRYPTIVRVDAHSALCDESQVGVRGTRRGRVSREGVAGGYGLLSLYLAKLCQALGLQPPDIDVERRRGGPAAAMNRSGADLLDDITMLRASFSSLSCLIWPSAGNG